MHGVTDITRSLQHKHEIITKIKVQKGLLVELNVIDENQKPSPLGGEVNVLAEPSATLPLWRRVDRQFWWNEWLLKPFVDAGVSCHQEVSNFCTPLTIKLPIAASFLCSPDYARFLSDNIFQYTKRAGGRRRGRFYVRRLYPRFSSLARSCRFAVPAQRNR